MSTLAIVVLMVIAIGITEIQRLGVGKDLAYASFRTFIQLMLVGYVIQFVFDINKLVYEILLLFLMAIIAGYTGAGRVKRSKDMFLGVLIAILSGSTITLGLLLALRLIDTSPRFLIPLGGMIIGNTMNNSSILLSRLVESVKDERLKIEAKLALGASPNQSIHSVVKKSVKLSLIPLINSLKVVGLVQLPGAMTGMILAGASPLEATKLQLMVMYMLSVSVIVGITVISYIAPLLFFTDDCRLKEV